MTTSAELFDRAIHFHRSGDLGQAERLYRQVLDIEPSYPNVHSNLGIALFAQGRNQEALACLHQAVALNPNQAAAHVNLGNLLVVQGDRAAAIASFRQALQLNPNLADAHNSLGNALKEQGNVAEAIEAFRQALRLNPSHLNTLFNLGNSLRERGELDEAMKCYQGVLRASPNNPDAYNLIGVVLMNQNKPDEAAAWFQRALAIDPRHVFALNNLGNALVKQKRLAEAMRSFEEAVRINPGYADAYYNAGNVFKDEGELDRAIECYQTVVRMDPSHADAHNNLGNALHEQKRYSEAAEHYRQVLRINPNYAEVMNNLGVTLTDAGQLAEAESYLSKAIQTHKRPLDVHVNLACVQGWLRHFDAALDHYAKALRIDPGHHTSLWNRALLLLQLGRYEDAWPGYEQRWAQPDRAPRTFQQPRWDGGRLDGKSILVWAEQGIGDTLQFVRYLPMVKERGPAKLIFETQSLVQDLLRGMPSIDQLVLANTPLPAFDVQVPLLSLPGIFNTTLATIPGGVPYLHADPISIEKWKKELAPISGFKVGIVWQGNPDNKADRNRSLPLSYFEPLARIEGVRLVSLQVGPGTEQLPKAGFPVVDLGSRFNRESMGDLAAVMTNLDLVVTVESAPAHLAGALGVPTWVVLHFLGDWRWLMDRTDSPWYPSLRLFRQNNYGNWNQVFADVATALSGRLRPSA